MLLLQTSDIAQLIRDVGLQSFFLKLHQYLQEDFGRWASFDKSPRHAVYAPQGVIELMPIAQSTYYSFKYVNGHPRNPWQHKLTVVAFGVLAEMATGYPLFMTDMTLLTALRTAATSALSSLYLAKRDSQRLAIIGCGAQSEFQVLAHHALFHIAEVHYYDIDPQAMSRFSRNLATETFTLKSATSVQAAVESADIIITTTAAHGRQDLLQTSWLRNGQHICAMGGDSPGKTELNPDLLKQSKIVVEYFPQTAIEGEIQNLAPDAARWVYAELWELVTRLKPGRQTDSEITLFDGVGFALEDFSTLRLCFQLAQEMGIGQSFALCPEGLSDPKNLFELTQA